MLRGVSRIGGLLHLTVTIRGSWPMTWGWENHTDHCTLSPLHGSPTVASLIICPLLYNWEHEIRRFCAGPLRCCFMVGSGSERRTVKEVGRNSRDYQVIITSYDLLRRDIGLYEGVHFRYQAIDEAGQYIKNASTGARRAVKSLTQTRFAHRLQLKTVWVSCVEHF